MALKRKLVVSTIAASVAATAFAGIPLSSKGLAEKVGFSSVAYAADSSALDDYFAKLQPYYDALEKEGTAHLFDNLRDKIVDAINENPDMFDGILDKLELGSDRAKFVEMLRDIADTEINADWKGSILELEDEYDDFLNGLDPDIEALTVSDIAEVVAKLQIEVLEIIGDSDMDARDLALSLLEDESIWLDAARSALNANSDVKALVNKYGITASDLESVAIDLLAELRKTVSFDELDEVLQAAKDIYEIVNGSSGGGNNGGGGSGGGGGGGGGTTTVVDDSADLPKSVLNLEEKFKDLAAQLASATEAEKAAILAAALEEAQALIDTLSNLDISDSVKIVDGKAVLTLNDKETITVLAGLGKINELLESIGVAKADLPKLSLILDLKQVEQAGVTVNMSDAIVDAAIDNGVASVIVKVNGLSATLPIGGELSGAVTFDIQMQAASEEATGGLQAASLVYDFNLTVDEEAITSFSTPIVISIPLTSLDGVDQELLSVAKIVDGKLQFQGGRVSGSSIVEARDTFSSYVVVENKVSFTDIASVQEWAGRAIEVIAAKGAIEGKSEGVFAPKDQVTRAEFAKMLIHAFDLENGNAKESFGDVASTDWFGPYVAAAAELGIINGRSAASFAPNATITRAEMATMIARALKVTQGSSSVTDVDAVLAQFADASSISSTLKEGVAFAASQGIVEGNGGKFNPQASATRAEAATMIYRAYNN